MFGYDEEEPAASTSAAPLRLDRQQRRRAWERSLDLSSSSSSSSSEQFRYVCCTVTLKKSELSRRSHLIEFYQPRRGESLHKVPAQRKRSCLRYIECGRRDVLFFSLTHIHIRTRRKMRTRRRKRTVWSREKRKASPSKAEGNLSSRTRRILNNISTVYDIMDSSGSIFTIPLATSQQSPSSSWTFRAARANY